MKKIKIVYEKIDENTYHELVQLENGHKRPFKWIGSWIAYEEDGEKQLYALKDNELKKVFQRIRELPKGSIIVEGYRKKWKK